ncbi:MAG: DUF6350 family protein [Actinomycetia bacterium]|nr:DUF6350 family protein [Actinomycetes bacterium]
MSPLELLRRVLPESDAPAKAGADPARRGTAATLARSALHGALAGLITLVPMLVLGTVLWLTTADIQLSWAETMQAGTSFWLLGHGIPILIGTGIIGIVPLALFLLVLWVGVWSAGRSTWAAAEHGWRPALSVACGWALGYALLLLVVGGIAMLGPMEPRLGRWIGAAIVVPALMAVVGMVRSLDHDDVDEFLERCFVPAALRRAWRPALHATVVIVTGGTLAAIAAVALSFDEVWALQSDLRPGVAGGITLGLLQVLALPNIGVWISSFVAGPGFSIVDGASVTWSGAETALVPMVPVFAAHPQPVELPGFMPFLAGLLVVLGAWLGWQCLAATARLASLRAKAVTVMFGAAFTGLLVGLLDWVGGGALGIDRLADIGAPAGLLGLVVTGWLLLGAAAVLAWDWHSLDR